MTGTLADDDAADTLRFNRIDLSLEETGDPGETSIYDLRRPTTIHQSSAQRRRIQSLRRDVARLRSAVAAGWDVAPELEHEERRLAELESSST